MELSSVHRILHGTRPNVEPELAQFLQEEFPGGYSADLIEEEALSAPELSVQPGLAGRLRSWLGLSTAATA